MSALTVEGGLTDDPEGYAAGAAVDVDDDIADEIAHSPAMLRVDFGRHLEANFPRLVAQLYAITLDSTEAHEVVQDAYSRAWRNWAEISSSPDPTGWIRRVAVRSTFRSWRRWFGRMRVRRARPVVDERTEALFTALGRLKPKERRAAVLFYMAGASLGEIATLERVSLSTVQVRLSFARHVITQGVADVFPDALDGMIESYDLGDYRDDDAYLNGYVADEADRYDEFSQDAGPLPDDGGPDYEGYPDGSQTDEGGHR